MSPDDYLNRDEYLNTLHRHIENLSAIPAEKLPSPRVIAVDAPWGHGKSWIAARLKTRLASLTPAHKVVAIDAFRYDHHCDAFAVIAGAIYKELKPGAEARRKFLKATGAVLKAGVPALTKAAVGLGARALGLDADSLGEAGEALLEAGEEQSGGFSEKAVAALLDNYASTSFSHDNFLAMLGQLTASLDKPLVVLIDELDRCKPSFALEALERIKHLFSADKVVFVLFWNAPAIHSIVRHTYGQDFDAERYLSKFVALTLPLPVKGQSHHEPMHAYEQFLDGCLRQALSALPDGADRFRVALSQFALAMAPSLRDLQKVVHLYATVVQRPATVQEPEFAYLALLKVMHESTFKAVASFDAHACEEQADLLKPFEASQESQPLTEVWASLSYFARPKHFDDLAANHSQGQSREEGLVMQAIFNGRVSCRRLFENSAQVLQSHFGVT